MPITRFGLPVPPVRARQRQSNDIPPSIEASLEPVVEWPVASPLVCPCHSSASMFTQRISSSAVCGYSSLSIMFLSNVSAISAAASGSIQVVTKVARFRRALPSRISSSRTTRAATAAGIVASGIRKRGTSPARVGRGEQRVDRQLLQLALGVYLAVEGHGGSGFRGSVRRRRLGGGRGRVEVGEAERPGGGPVEGDRRGDLQRRADAEQLAWLEQAPAGILVHALAGDDHRRVAGEPLRADA